MDRSAPTAIRRQVNRVRRRLFLQLLLTSLLWAWVAALVGAAVWFLAQPYLIPDAEPWLRWAVLGGLVAVATVGAFVWAFVRRPSAVAAALSLDERFGLKERVTTTLTLRPDETASPAAQALLADVTRYVTPLRVGERFRVRVPWSAALVPAGAVVLALLAFFYNPLANPAQGKPAEEPLDVPPALKADLARKLKVLRKKKKEDEPALTSKELKRLEAELDKLAEKQPKTTEQAREMVKEMTDLEKMIQERQKEMADRVDALKEQMKQAAKATKKEEKDGPGKKLDRAMQQANFRKAEEEAERLRKKMKAKEEAERLRKKMKEEGERLTKKEKQDIQEQIEKLEKEGLSKEEEEQLERQMQDLQDQLQRLTRDQEEKLKEEEEKLKKEKDKEELSKEEEEQLDRELEQLEEQKGELQELEEVAEKAGECKKCMKEGKDGEAGQKLQEMKGKLQKLQEKQGGEQQQLARKLQQLRQARKAVAKALNNKAGQGWGKRPESKEGETGSREVKAPSELDEGRLQIVDFVPGQGFKGPKKPSEMADDIRRAAEAAPDAIDRQRLPHSASEMAKGYFDKLREAGKKKQE
jgi:hypothetical protein